MRVKNNVCPLVQDKTKIKWINETGGGWKKKHIIVCKSQGGEGEGQWKKALQMRAMAAAGWHGAIQSGLEQGRARAKGRGKCEWKG